MRFLKYFLFVISLIILADVALLLIKSRRFAEDYRKEAAVKPVLELPFDTTAKLPDTIIPMGETINHADGHPGIDFQWHDGDNVKITASMNATVTRIMKNDRGTYDIFTKYGKWSMDYTELESINPQLKKGSQVASGDFIGIPNHPPELTQEPKYRMIHWQFGYAFSLREKNWTQTMSGYRLCPMNYFSPPARTLIEKLWADTYWPEMKANAPDICSGKYKGLNE